ncbi:MAG TPA: sensor histidine kinase [Candidatus Saccharimonadales bacterium]|nr:sensor histidine kinase [Candidatus Saccharimonadales bacterium]
MGRPFAAPVVHIMRGTFHGFKKLLLAARLKDEDLRRRGLVLNVILVATLVTASLSALILCFGYFSGYHFVLSRLIINFGVILIVVGLFALVKIRRLFWAAFGILIMYELFATLMTARWSIGLPMGILLYAVVIVLAGMLLGARYSLYLLALSVAALTCLQLATMQGLIHPDTLWQRSPAKLSDLAGYCLAFSMLGVSSWLFNRQTDQALGQALRAEAALTRQKELLEAKVIERTKALQTAQLEKTKQLQRFAQLGQYSTSLMHDVANHLATLSIDIEGMEEKYHSSDLVRRAKKHIEYIDNMVQGAYEHLNGKVQLATFDALRETDKVVAILQHNARLAGVQLSRTKDTAKKRPITLHGDPSRFRQIVTNLAANAIEACQDAKTDKKQVLIVVRATGNGAVTLLVEDNGKGIPAAKKSTIFEPFYSTKQQGMGIGLFTVKQIVEEYFAGTIDVTSKVGHTVFRVTLNGIPRE